MSSRPLVPSRLVWMPTTAVITTMTITAPAPTMYAPEPTATSLMWLAITDRYFSDAGRLRMARPDRRPTCPAMRKGWMTGEKASPRFSAFRGRAIALPDGVRDEGEVGVGHDQVDDDEGDQSEDDAPVDGHADARGPSLGIEALPR